MPNEKGDRRERELRDLFRDAGWTVLRVPASGSAPKDDLPDLFVGDGDRMWAVEVKSSQRGDYIYIPLSEVQDLVSFARGFHRNVRPRLGVRYDYGEFRIRDALDAFRDYHTDSGSVRISEESVAAWDTFEESLGDAYPD